MAEFVQTMKDWRRMCQHNTKMFGNNRCNMCSLVRCEAIYEDYGGMNYADVENKVNAWAAEHQEPVYPTWEEWLQNVGVMESSEGLLRRVKGQLYIDGIPAHAVPTAKVLQPMNADIAQKLGLKPKEG